MLDLRQANRRLRDFVAHQELGPFQDSLERLFVTHDETIITQGDPGDEAYLIITGQVLVTTPWAHAPSAPEMCSANSPSSPTDPAPQPSPPPPTWS